jgi:hypothetical protein
MTGWEDLERDGRWDTHPDYGPVWMPTTVVSNWAPYRYGHWAWVRPWGWTWVDDAPWGFAPFHYGRWVMVGGHWCWAPGRYVSRPVYAPALVAWIGGPHASVNVRVGGPPHVGWVPLAPREAYYPHYRAGGGYWKAVNSAHLHLFPNQTYRPPTGPVLYANQRVPGAVSVVPSASLQPRRPIAPVVAQVDPSVRGSFTTTPSSRTHVPPPGVARIIAVPGNQPTSPVAPQPAPTRPALPPRPPGQQPTPAVMAQPTLPPAAVPGAGAEGRERRPRGIPPPPLTAQPQAQAPGLRTPGGTGARLLPSPPSQAAPLPNQPAAPVQPRVAPPGRVIAPQTQAPPEPPVQRVPAPTQPAAPTPPAQRRFDPGERGGGMRREPPGRSSALPEQPAPHVRAMPTPQATAPRPVTPTARMADRVERPQPPALREVPHVQAPRVQASPPAQPPRVQEQPRTAPESRARAPERGGNSNHDRMR